MAVAPPRLAIAVAAVLSNPRLDAAAAAAGIAPRTLRNWRALPEFQQELERQRRALVAQAADALRSAGIDAVLTLQGVLADPDCSPAVKVQACGCILSHLFRATEVADMAERMDKLEESREREKHSVN